MTLCSRIDNSYIIPSNLGNEIVILTDEEMNYGVMNVNNDTLALTGDTVKLLNEAFFTSYPSTVSNLNPDNNSNIVALLEDLASNRAIALSPTPLINEPIIPYNVDVGEVINRGIAGAAVNDPVIAEYAGRVLCIKIGPVSIYIYFSFTSLLKINCGSTNLLGYNAILDFGSYGATVLPEPTKMALGANCSVCGACGGCGACGACALCGGLNYGAAAIALVAVDAALSVTSALNFFTTKAPN